MLTLHTERPSFIGRPSDTDARADGVMVGSRHANSLWRACNTVVQYCTVHVLFTHSLVSAAAAIVIREEHRTRRSCDAPKQ